MKFIIIFAVFIFATADAGILDAKPGHVSSGNTSAYHNCRSRIAPVSGLKSEEFAGLWYLDSSTSTAYVAGTCCQYKFTWFAHSFTHHHVQYDGYFRYWWRFDRVGHSRCFQQCSFSRHGYLHGFSSTYSEGPCKNDEVDPTAVLTDSDPCHPHYPDHWDFWVLKTDYKRYALTWLCSDGRSQLLLLNRSRKNFSAAFREEIQRFLRQHGINGKLLVAPQTTC